jgi:2-polyprenyl-6-methoxyphenol hydroxylase-like FAD-dependent oxidoreductase
MEPQHPIIIAGAGIAGLTLAAGLTRNGRSLLVVERSAGLANQGAGISLWPNALSALDTIGLGDAVRSVGGTVSSGGVRRPDGSWIRNVDTSVVEAALGEPMVAIHRNDLLTILASTLDPSSVRFGASLQSFEVLADGVRVLLGDGSIIDGCALVGADGIGSVVTKELSPDLVLTYTGYTAWRGVADFDVSDFDPSATWGPGSEFGLIPLGADRVYWFATENTAEGARSIEGELNHLLGRFSSWHAPIPDVLRATDPSTVLRHDIHDRSRLRAWSRGPVVVIGDAAHPMRPHLGQGGCQSIEDGAMLATMIGRQSEPASVFAEFYQRRNGRIRPIVRESALVGKVIQGEGPLASLARRLGPRVPLPLMVGRMRAISGRDSFAVE